MGNWLDRQKDPCSRWQAWLETYADDSPVADWSSLLSANDRDHLNACSECRVAIEGWRSFRESLHLAKLAAPAPPWFPSRVMTAIIAREEESRPIAAWIAVPRFASRLAWASAALLVFAGTWLYEKPPTHKAKPSVSASESLFDTQPPSQADDEVLVSSAEPKP